MTWPLNHLLPLATPTPIQCDVPVPLEFPAPATMTTSSSFALPVLGAAIISAVVALHEIVNNTT